MRAPRGSHPGPSRCVQGGPLPASSPAPQPRPGCRWASSLPSGVPRRQQGVTTSEPVTLPLHPQEEYAVEGLEWFRSCQLPGQPALLGSHRGSPGQHLLLINEVEGRRCAEAPGRGFGLFLGPRGPPVPLSVCLLTGSPAPGARSLQGCRGAPMGGFPHPSALQLTSPPHRSAADRLGSAAQLQTRIESFLTGRSPPGPR